MSESLIIEIVGNNALSQKLVEMSEKDNRFHRIITTSSTRKTFATAYPDVVVIAGKMKQKFYAERIERAKREETPIVYGVRRCVAMADVQHLTQVSKEGSIPVAVMPYAEKDFVDLYRALSTALCRVGKAPCEAEIRSFTSAKDMDRDEFASTMLMKLFIDKTHGYVIPKRIRTRDAEMPEMNEVHQVFLSSTALSSLPSRLLSTSLMSVEAHAKGLLDEACRVHKMARHADIRCYGVEDVAMNKGGLPCPRL